MNRDQSDRSQSNNPQRERSNLNPQAIDKNKRTQKSENEDRDDSRRRSS